VYVGQHQIDPTQACRAEQEPDQRRDPLGVSIALGRRMVDGWRQQAPEARRNHHPGGAAE